MPIPELPADDRPRERLLRLGARSLSDAELVALLLGSGSTSISAVGHGQRLLADRGGVDGLVSSFAEELVVARVGRGTLRE